MIEDTLHTVKEVAEIFEVDPETVRRWIRRGKIKYVKVGERFIRIPRKEIERLMGEE